MSEAKKMVESRPVVSNTAESNTAESNTAESNTAESNTAESNPEKKSGTTVLCGANSYEQKYYFNKDYDRLPQQIKDELQIMCVAFTENVGGVLLVEFDAAGDLRLTTQADDADYLYDEIECGIQIGRIQREKEELFGQLELFNKIISGT